jgi:gp16 family phage-associated protein
VNGESQFTSLNVLIELDQLKGYAMSDETKTPEQVKRCFAEAGVSVNSWARLHGYDRALVHALLSGKLKGTYGKAHEIAVALGLKKGVVVSLNDFSPATASVGAQA